MIHSPLWKTTNLSFVVSQPFWKEVKQHESIISNYNIFGLNVQDQSKNKHLCKVKFQPFELHLTCENNW